MSDRPIVITSSGLVCPPVWPYLKDEYELVSTVPESVPWMKQQGYTVSNLIDYMPKMDRERIWTIVAKIMSTVNWGAQFGKFNWPGWTCDSQDWLMGFAMANLGEMVPRILALNELKKTRKIAGVLLHEDVTNQTQYIAQWAKVNGIPSVHVLHGNYSGMDEWRAWDVHVYLTCDVACVWNDNAKAMFVAHGADPDNVVVTGGTTTDAWCKRVPDKSHARAMLRLSADRPVVMFSGTFDQKVCPNTELQISIEDEFNLFLEAFKRLEGWQLIVNPHPGRHKWDANWYAERCKAHSVHAAILPFGLDGLRMAVEAADVLYTCGKSMVNYEAAILNLNSVCPDTLEAPPEFWIRNERTVESTAESIKLALGREKTSEWQEARAKTLYDTLYLCDGRNSERVAAVVRKTFASAN